MRYTNGERGQGECHLQARAVIEKSGYCANHTDAGSTVPGDVSDGERGWSMAFVMDQFGGGEAERAREEGREREREIGEREIGREMDIRALCTVQVEDVMTSARGATGVADDDGSTAMR